MTKDGDKGELDNSMEASDPFGLTSLARRRRRLPVALEPYLTPQKPNMQQQQPQQQREREKQHQQQTFPPRFDYAVSPIKKENNRITLETMSSTASLLTTPVSNHKDIRRGNESFPAAATTWNVSRISPQETVSVISMIDDVQQEQQPQKRGGAGVETSMASHTMRQQMLQLVSSLQSNLSESQEIRSHQQVELRMAQQEIAALHKQVQDLREQGLNVQDVAEQRMFDMDQKLQNMELSSSEKDRVILKLEQQLQESQSESQKAHQSLHNLRIEHASLSQSLARQSESHQGAEEIREALKQERHDLELDRQLIKQEQERWQQEHKEIREQSLLYDSQMASLKHDASILARERAQIKSLQQQLVEMQVAQMEMEAAQNDEEERLVQIAGALDNRVQEMHQRESALQNDRQRLDDRKREQDEEISRRESNLKESQQNLSRQQIMLESWDTTLRDRQVELDAKASELTAIEANLRQKGQELTHIIQEQRGELEEKTRSVDAKYALTLQAVEELTSKRLEEESRLEAAVLNLEQAHRQHEELQADKQETIEALELKIQRSQDDCNEIQRQLSVRTIELDDLMERIKQLRADGEQYGREANERQKDAAANLHDIQTDLEDAERRKTNVHTELLAAKGELEKVLYLIEDERAVWEHEKQIEAENEHRLLTHRREDVDQEIQLAREFAQNELSTIFEKANARQDLLSRELMAHMDQIDRMRLKVETASQNWRKKHEGLEKEKQEVNEQQRRLDQLVFELENARADQNARRDGLDLENQRLQKLLESERQRHDDEFERLSNDSSNYLHRIRQQHLDEIAELTQNWDSKQSSLEQKNNLLREQQTQLELQHQQEVGTFSAKMSSLQADLNDARRQTVACETELKLLRQQLAHLNSDEAQGRDKIRALIDRMESSNASLAVKETKLVDREKELSEQREQLQRQSEQINKTNEDLQRMKRELRDKENELCTQKSNLERQVSQLEQQELQVHRKLRRLAMKSLTHKSWREDKEVVSASFSKWLRVTMMEGAADAAAVAEHTEIEALRGEVVHRDDLLKLKEAELATKEAELRETRAELKAMEMRCLSRSDELNSLKAELNHHRSALHDAEDRLEQSQLQTKANNYQLSEQLKKEREELSKHQQQLQSDRTALSQLDKFLQSKRNHLADLERRASNDTTAALERKISEQQKTINEIQASFEATQAKLAQNENEMTERTKIVEDAEQKLLVKEQRISSEVLDIKKDEAQVRRMAEELRVRELTIVEEENRLSQCIREFEDAHERVRTMARELEGEKLRHGLGNGSKFT